MISPGTSCADQANLKALKNNQVAEVRTTNLWISSHGGSNVVEITDDFSRDPRVLPLAKRTSSDADYRIKWAKRRETILCLQCIL